MMNDGPSRFKGELDLETLKLLWNEVLDQLESSNRIAWLAYFDARLVSLDGNKLTLSFTDSTKFGGAHDFHSVRSTSHREALQTAIRVITGVSLVIQDS